MLSSVLPKQRVRHIWRVWLGRACNHIKAFDPAPFPHQRKVSIDGILAQYPLSILGSKLYMCVPPPTHTHAHTGMRKKQLLFYLKLVLIQTFKQRQGSLQLQQQYTRRVLMLWSCWLTIQRLIFVYQYVHQFSEMRCSSSSNARITVKFVLALQAFLLFVMQRSVCFLKDYTTFCSLVPRLSDLFNVC